MDVRISLYPTKVMGNSRMHSRPTQFTSQTKTERYQTNLKKLKTCIDVNKSFSYVKIYNQEELAKFADPLSTKSGHRIVSKST